MMDRKTVPTTFSLTRRWARLGLAAGCAALVLFAFSAAAAQTPDEETDAPTEPKVQETQDQPDTAPVKPTAKTHPNDPMVWDIEQMMEDAVTQITRRYNLNVEQEKYTRLLLKTRVREFLKDYEGDVRELLQESIRMKNGQAASDSAALQQWADRAKPLYGAAMDAILDGNAEWGQILDEEQKKTHDGDLKLMRANAEAVNKTLDDWSAGKGKFPVVAAGQNGAARTVPNKGEAGQISDGGRQTQNVLIEGNWTAYVNTFINVYHLTEKQQSSARDAILKDQLAKAAKYRESNKEKFAKIEADLRELTPNLPPQASQLRRSTLEAKKRDLEKPIRILFVELDRRLKMLPDREQQAGADPLGVKALEAQYNMLAKEPAERTKQGKTNVKIKPDVPPDDKAAAKIEEGPMASPTASAPTSAPTSAPATIAPVAKEPAQPVTPQPIASQPATS